MILQQIFVDDKKAKVSLNDTTPGYLNGKLTAGTGVSLTEGSDGGDETLSIANTDTGSGAVASHVLAADPHTQYALLSGRASGQLLKGGVASGENLTLQSTAHVTKGKIYFGLSSFFDESNSYLELINASSKAFRISHTAGSIFADFQVDTSGNLKITTSGDKVYLPTGKKLHIGDDVSGFEGYDFTVNGKNGGIILKRASTNEPFLLLFNNTTNSGGQFRGLDAGGFRFTNSAGTVNFLQATTAGITFFGGASGVDYTLTLNGQTLDGVLTWMEDEGRLDFDSHFALKVDNKKLYFGAGYDFSLYYDGTSAYLKTDEVAASDLHLTTGADKSLILENGLLALKETTTPTAVADYGRIYTKSDNKLYFQDGAGTEHEIQFV